MSRSITKVLEIAAGLIIGFFLLLVVIGIMLPDPAPANASTTVNGTGTFPTVTDLQWINSTRENSAMFLQFSNEITNIMSGKQEMNAQRLLFCAGEVSSWARGAQKQSKDMEVSPELDNAKAEYAKATGEYATMGDYINDGVLAFQRGNKEDGEKFLLTGLEHKTKADTHYNKYLNMIKN